MKKHYRYKKVSPKDEIEMKDLYRGGLSSIKIAEMFGLSKEAVLYHVNPKYRMKSLNRSKAWQKRHRTKRSMRKANKKHQAYRSAYIKDRYANDPEFKKRLIEMIKKYQSKKKKEWLKKGLCPKCGRKRLDDYKYCRRCRKNWNYWNKKYRKRGKNGQVQNNKRHNKNRI